MDQTTKSTNRIYKYFMFLLPEWLSQEGILAISHYGIWLKEWCLLQRSVFVLDRNDRLVYAEYVADQLREPNYAAALQAVQQAAVHETAEGCE